MKFQFETCFLTIIEEANISEYRKNATEDLSDIATSKQTMRQTAIMEGTMMKMIGPKSKNTINFSLHNSINLSINIHTLA